MSFDKGSTALTFSERDDMIRDGKLESHQDGSAGIVARSKTISLGLFIMSSSLWLEASGHEMGGGAVGSDIRSRTMSFQRSFIRFSRDVFDASVSCFDMSTGSSLRY